MTDLINSLGGVVRTGISGKTDYLSFKMREMRNEMIKLDLINLNLFINSIRTSIGGW